MCLLIVMALGITAYLVYTDLAAKAIVCTEDAQFSCQDVHNSVYGKLFGIRLSYIGLAGNLLLLSLALLEDQIEYALATLFVVLIFGVLYSIYLIYVQAFWLETYCQWCLAHESIYFLLLAVVGVRVWQSITE